MNKRRRDYRRRKLLEYVEGPAKPFSNIEWKARIKANIKDYNMPRY